MKAGLEELCARARERKICAVEKLLLVKILFEEVPFKASFEGRVGRTVTESEKKRILALGSRELAKGTTTISNSAMMSLLLIVMGTTRYMHIDKCIPELDRIASATVLIFNFYDPAKTATIHLFRRIYLKFCRVNAVMQEGLIIVEDIPT